MKTKLLLTIALLSTLQIIAQTNGWYVYDKALEITSITPDDTNTNELHLGTSLGYIKYNTSTNMVTDFLNFTSQNPAIAKVKDIAVNPTNNTIAFTMPGAVTIYDGTTVTKHTYQNSSLTLGVSASAFTFLQVEYGVNGELYIFKADVSGYQIFNNGVFETEVVTAFRPQDIVENQAGTKVYFAGSNNGLWQLEKSTNTLTNFTSSNSPIITNTLNSLHVDANDLLYVGGFQGLNTMTPAGVWNTYQQMVPPANIFFYPVYDISVNSVNGNVLINTSRPSSQDGKGFCIVDLTTNTWTSFTNDATNCLNENYFDDATYDANNNVFMSHTIGTDTDVGELVLFNPTTDACTAKDINYLNAEVTSTFNVSGFNVRKKLSGTYDIGFTKFGDLHQFNIDPTTFSGVFPSVTTITPSTGQPAFSLLSDNDFFIVENNTGWVFVDDANNTTEFSHNLPNYLAIVTQKAAAFNSSNGIINLVHKGFDAAFNYRVYKTQCNTATATCSVLEEIFTTNRDLTKNIFFSCSTNNGVVTCFGIKTLPPLGGNVSRIGPAGMGIESVFYDALLNDPDSPFFDESLPIVPDNKNPLVLYDETGNPIYGVVENSALTIRDIDSKGNPFFTPFPIDLEGDGQEDKILSDLRYIRFLSNNSSVEFIRLTIQRYGVASIPEEIENIVIRGRAVPLPGDPLIELLEIPESIFEIPLDFFERDFFLIELVDKGIRQASEGNKSQIVPTLALMVKLTNYGILIKTDLDISNLVLSTDDVSLKDANLLLYPNPANDIVSFSNNSIKTIAVYDINGRKVLSKTNSNSFSVKTLAQGVYIVKGTSDTNVVVTKKLIVE